MKALLISICLMTVVGCSSRGAAPAAREDQTTRVASIAPSSGPAKNPFAEHAVSPEARYSIEGDVIEELAAGPYVYLHVAPADGPARWVVTLAFAKPASRHVTALVMGSAKDFASRRLNRRFDELLFAVVD